MELFLTTGSWPCLSYTGKAPELIGLHQITDLSGYCRAAVAADAAAAAAGGVCRQGGSF